ncbi:MAG TPA: hypothetical protein VGX28_06355 [Frankiaceae bacterium]|nr:hypothetical protein [Frankiaceae bacterium]
MTGVAPTPRFLLDQGFPKPPAGFEQLDASVEYVHFSDAAPDLARTSTPDWMVYLFAQAQQFDGLVTGDISQVTQDTELVALAHTSLCVVTWRGAHNVSPVTKWGQILAYTPQVLRHVGQTADGVVVTLPSPVLPTANVTRAVNLARARAEIDATSWNERRSENLRLMRAELERRHALGLTAVLDRG